MKKNWISLVVILITIFLSSIARAHIVRLKYRVRKVESLADIYKKFIDMDNIIHADQEFVQMTLEVNDDVKNWTEIEKGTVVSLFIDEDFMTEEVYAKFDKERKTPYSEKLARSIASREKLSFQKKLDAFQGKTSFSLFYMASSGTYSQDVDATSGSGIDLNQDSPVSFGGMVSHKFHPTWSVSTSAYFSQFDKAILNGNTTAVPNEYGGNVYGYYSGLKGVGVYGGFDYEKLSSFSLQDLINNQSLSYDTHDFVHLTAGVDFFKTWSKKLYLIKFAVSMNVVSKTTSEFVTEGKNFSGMRYLAYLNTPITKNVFLHGLLKYHDFADEEKMQILRLGFGGGIRF
jgi:hypothetical protein